MKSQKGCLGFLVCALVPLWVTVVVLLSRALLPTAPVELVSLFSLWANPGVLFVVATVGTALTVFIGAALMIVTDSFPQVNVSESYLLGAGWVLYLFGCLALGWVIIPVSPILPQSMAAIFGMYVLVWLIGGHVLIRSVNVFDRLSHQ